MSNKTMKCSFWVAYVLSVILLAFGLGCFVIGYFPAKTALPGYAIQTGTLSLTNDDSPPVTVRTINYVTIVLNTGIRWLVPRLHLTNWW